MLEESLMIINKLGLHARAAAQFVSHAARYGSSIRVCQLNAKTQTQTCVNGKSIMGMMSLGAVQGTYLSLSIEGEDEVLMMQDLKDLMANRFGESE